MVHCRSAFEQGASGIPYYCTPPVSLLLHTTWSIAGVPSSRALLGFSITALLLFFHHHSHCVAAKPKKNALRECHLIRSGPGVSGLPYYRTPPLTVPDVIGGLAVWRHNTQKKKTRLRYTYTTEEEEETLQINIHVCLSAVRFGQAPVGKTTVL